MEIVRWRQAELATDCGNVTLHPVAPDEVWTPLRSPERGDCNGRAKCHSMQLHLPDLRRLIVLEVLGGRKLALRVGKRSEIGLRPEKSAYWLY